MHFNITLPFYVITSFKQIQKKKAQHIDKITLRMAFYVCRHAIKLPICRSHNYACYFQAPIVIFTYITIGPL